jgi:hypothetical protein
MNLVSDIYVLNKPFPGTTNKGHEDYKDRYGKSHHIYINDDLEDLSSHLNSHIPYGYPVILDIDADYFMEQEEGNVELPDKIENLLTSLKKLFFFDLMHSLSGITIALEPTYCGSLGNSIQILQAIDRVIFANRLLATPCINDYSY